MAKEIKIKAEDSKELKLKPEHADSTLTYNGVDYRTKDASQEQLELLFNAPDDIWKYLFEI